MAIVIPNGVHVHTHQFGCCLPGWGPENKTGGKQNCFDPDTTVLLMHVQMIYSEEMFGVCIRTS